MAKTRARTKSGEFVGDDPSTPQNEAWASKKSSTKKPAKRPKSPKRPKPPKGSAEHKAMVLRGEIKE
jgi:hypothetical protein